MDCDLFEDLCTKFLFTNYNGDQNSSTSNSELNALLNQLNDACHNNAMIIPPQVRLILLNLFMKSDL